jgi:hypothetical protein
MRPAQAGCGRKRRGGGRQQTLRAGGAQAGWAVMNERHNATDERFHPCPGGRHWGPRRGGHPPLHRSGRRPRMGAAVPSIPARPARRHLEDVRRRYRRGRDRVAGCGPRDLQGNPGDHAGTGRHCRGYVWECPQGCGWPVTVRNTARSAQSKSARANSKTPPRSVARFILLLDVRGGGLDDY